MRQILFFCILSFCYASTSMAYEETDITVNGLYEGKAILLIKGKPVLLEQGELKQGVKLIEASKDRVVVEIKGKRRTLFLDNTIAEEYSGSKKAMSRENVKTHIVSIDLIHQTPSLATFEVDYYYDGEKGDYMTLTARTYYEGQATQFSSHSYTRLSIGRHQPTITISMNDKSPEAYLADQIRFEIQWASENNNGILDFKLIEFPKHWKR